MQLANLQDFFRLLLTLSISLSMIAPSAMIQIVSDLVILYVELNYLWAIFFIFFMMHISSKIYRNDTWNKADFSPSRRGWRKSYCWFHSIFRRHPLFLRSWFDSVMVIPRGKTAQTWFGSYFGRSGFGWGYQVSLLLRLFFSLSLSCCNISHVPYLILA